MMAEIVAHAFIAVIYGALGAAVWEIIKAAMEKDDDE